MLNVTLEKIVRQSVETYRRHVMVTYSPNSCRCLSQLKMKEKILSYAVIIADDDEFFRIALRAILTSDLNCSEVVETASLDEAIEQLSDRDDFALALFDLAMPGMESAASLAAVREFHPELIMAVISASSRRSDILAALQAGVHGYIPKGIGVAELTEALRRVKEGNIFLPPSFAKFTSLGQSSVEAEGQTIVPAKSLLNILTPRQRDVLELVVLGDSNKRIAKKLDLSEGTVKIHVAALFRNLGVHNRATAAVSGSHLLSDKSLRERPPFRKNGQNGEPRKDTAPGWFQGH